VDKICSTALAEAFDDIDRARELIERAAKFFHRDDVRIARLALAHTRLTDAIGVVAQVMKDDR
jgi:hypothetical protein